MFFTIRTSRHVLVVLRPHLAGLLFSLDAAWELALELMRVTFGVIGNAAGLIRREGLALPARSGDRTEAVMAEVVQIGESPFRREAMIAGLEEFARLYAKRPIQDNAGGMKAPHMFMTWFALRTLQPKVIVESGVFLGQGTWLLEQACPDAELYCIEPNLELIRYRSARAKYFDRDFAALDWSHLPKADTLLFFDDHQNAFERVKSARALGFTHAIFEDNYPASRGDCYSLKQAFAGSDFPPASGSLWKRITGAAPKGIPPNTDDAAYLRAALSVYQELPPVFRAERTRWKDPWDDTHYPTPPPLLDAVSAPHQQVYRDEATDYTWICYAKLKQLA